ncbi:MAG: DUF3857 domain-containing protein [Flavobacteriaceae bacterium]|nr:DUF3857 domain-containing protein [Flavobacteriaceae bacterium]
MNKLSVTVILLTVFSINQLFSQDVEFGDVTIAELQEKSYPLDSSANAAYLYKYRNTYIDGTDLVTEIHHKIKFYNKEGFDFATKKILLYKDGSDKENVSGLKAYTYNLVDGKIEKEQLSKDAIFNTEYHKRLNHYTFTMPNVREGSVIEYKYKIYSPFFSNIDEFKFQHAIPVKKLYSKLYTPAFFKFNRKIKGYLPVYPKMSHKRDNRINFEVNITEYEMSDIPALKEEPYVDDIDNYRSGVEYELVAVYYQTYTKSYSQTWNDVAKSVNKFETYKYDLDKHGYYKKDMDELVSNISSNEERVKRIFDFVKSKVKWNEVDGISSYNGMAKTYKEGVGNVADINLMLVSMLRSIDLDAYPVLLSTRDNGVPVFPTIDGLNYVICAVKLNNQTILLDATSKYASENILPKRVMNWFGVMVKPDDTMESIILVPTKMSQVTTMMSVQISPDGTAEGMCRKVYSDNNAFEFREDKSKTSESDYLLDLEKENNIEIADYSISNLDDLEKPVMENFKYNLEEELEMIDGKIYFSPLLFLTKKENPFKLAERQFPVDFAFPWEEKYQVTIKIPDNYIVETVPESISVKMPKEEASFSFMIKQLGNSIQIVGTVDVNHSKIMSEEYTFLKQFYNQIIKKENEKIVLTKKE